jgi:hypothetical protein
MAISFDGPNRIIELDGTLRESVRDIYSRWIDWAATSDNAKYLPAFSVIADPPKVPVYATLENGWRIRPSGQASPYVLTIYDGFIGTAEANDPFLFVSSGANPRIVYEAPVIAVGYEMGGTSLTPQDVWEYEERTLTDGGGGGINTTVIHVIGDTIIVADELNVPIIESVDVDMTVAEPVNNISSDEDAQLQVDTLESTATVEPDSTLGDS